MSVNLRLLPLLAAALPLASCASEPASPPAAEPAGPLAPDRDSELQRAIDRIALLEDRRSLGRGELQELAHATGDAVRLRAVQALTRLPYPELGAPVTEALAQALEDRSPEIRAMAAFGLGLRADPASGAAILGAWKDPDPTVRARLVEAASRFENPDLREEVLYAISDPSPSVRAEAVTAPHRWDPEGDDAAVVDSALAQVAGKAPLKLRRERWGLPEGADLEAEIEDPEVVWRALFSLARRRAERGREVFYLWCRAPEPVEARIFATMGLAGLADVAEPERQALREALQDVDWRVAVEAAKGLGRFPEPASISPLRHALTHPSTHVRLAAASALGGFADERVAVEPLLEKRLVDTSANVRAASIVALARLFGDETAADLEVRALDGDPRIRRAVAESAAYLSAAVAVPLLAQLSADEDHAVAYAAAVGLGDHLAAGGRERAHELLRSADNGVRLGAVNALKRGPDSSDLQPLLECYASSEGDIAGEIRYEILECAALVEDDRAFELLVAGLRDPCPFNRSTARRLLAEHFPAKRILDDGEMPPRSGEVPSVDGRRASPLVEVRTTRGTMLFELFPAEAPLHVYNFLTLAQRGDYGGLEFHRVVPDFVVQGGDYRGDGNGGGSWRGEPLRSELGPRKHVRGSLGMPRSADPDSGGGQLYVTHRPTPHLDGRYTVFGELRQGYAVLDAIEVGDRILDIRVRGVDE